MTIQDDETLKMYLEESLEHLSDIENDFLAIERSGENIDEELVNKVYRAAHSIKGGAGFMGLTTIKNLTHEMENILGKIRSRELVPTTEIINILLDASDTLRDLVKDVHNSNNVDISSKIIDLQKIAEGNVPPQNIDNSDSDQIKVKSTPTPQKNASLSDEIEIGLPDTPSIFIMSRNDIIQIMKDGKNIYLVNVNISADIINTGRTLQSLVEEMEQTGIILNSNMDLSNIENSAAENETPPNSQFVVMFASILKPSDINVLFEVDEQNIYLLSEDLVPQPIKEKATVQQKTEAISHNTQGSNQTIETSSIKDKKNTAMPKSSDIEDSNPFSENKLPEHIESVPAASIETSNHGYVKEQETSLRVNVSLLDQLMTLAGELVLSRNQLLQSMASEDKRSSETAGQRIDLITSELQEAIMLTRMQSIGNVFNKFPRVVRDLARSLGKKIELTLEGKDVELDKTIIEAIGDPLTHLVRNAVDHGIEQPKIRKKMGKNQVGQIFLKAYHEAGQVNIEISDDGKGLDGRKLAEKAIEKGLITDEQAKLMSDKERINLIFLPGFSTAEKITDVSGRGVGMDVVKTNLDKLGGLIDIDSKSGKGSTIKIKLPLTLAIIPSQIIMTGGERYAIPQVNLEELLRIPADQVKNRIERVGNAEVVRLRGNLLPLIKLANVIGVDSIYTDPSTGQKSKDRRKSISDRRGKKSALFNSEELKQETDQTDSDESEESREKRQEKSDRRYHSASALNIVVVSTGAMKYGLVVDELHDSEEIVVKPLGRDLKKCKGYAGATIMGDGRVALILDVSNLAQMAGLVSMDGTKRATEVARENQDALRAQKDMQSLLIFRSSEKEQFAAPLSLVERIEKIKATDIEYLGGKRVIKYRGGSLPLFSIEEVATVAPLSDAENLLVIVFTVAEREIGLLAIGPVDAVETNIDVDGSTLKQTGIMGSAIIHGNTTQLVDIYEIVKVLNPSWFTEPKATETNQNFEMAILFAEDSKFFRNQVKASMEDHGYKVLEAEDGAIAWDVLQDHINEIGIVVTDIEMPNLNGFELTRRIKMDPTYSHLPVIALTTLAGEEDVRRGKEVGIDDYQIKLDREKLMQSISNFIKGK